eukprot:COSAG06_NODE_4329_length_4361_cov_5.874472_3_plen_118_part_00
MPSTLDDISSVEMLESLITNDPRWAWILGAWEASADDEQVALARTVHRFRSNFVKETVGLVLKLLGDIQGPDDVKNYTSIAEIVPEVTHAGLKHALYNIVVLSLPLSLVESSTSPLE